LSIPRLWITPGGGVEPGESFEECARRELWEETGIQVPLGPCVWTRRIVHRWAEGLMDIDERYYVVRVDSIEVNAGKLTDWERTVLTEHRWFTVDDIARCDDVVAPRCLATILPDLLAGPYPTEPLTIGR
jgi:8-oxo-dGTP pyrophosphatase MutT (NUDIX family)